MQLSIEDLMPPAVAAPYIGVSAATLNYWRMHHPEKLPFIKHGRAKKPGAKVYYRRADLDAYLAAKGK